MTKDRINSGFTLVEVIISVAVLCIVCVVILQLFVAADGLNQDNVNADTAHVLALNKMEELKLLSKPMDIGLEGEPDFDGSFSSFEYYDENWNLSVLNNETMFIVETRLKPIGESLYLSASFGEASDNNQYISSLYEISVSVKDKNEDKVLVLLKSSKYYQYTGGQDD